MPFRDGAEQLVADRMAERVVDALEVVEVEAEHRERLAARATRASPSSICSRNSTRLGRSVSASWRAMWAMLCLGAVALGDVLVGRDPAALRHRLVRDLDDAAVGEVAVHDRSPAFSDAT